MMVAIWSKNCNEDETYLPKAAGPKSSAEKREAGLSPLVCCCVAGPSLVR